MEMESENIQRDVLSRARQSCYTARNAFYACLDKHSADKPTEIGCTGLLYPLQCKKSRHEFVNQCRPTWVKHFDRQYCNKKRNHRLLEDCDSRRGPMSLPQPSTFKPAGY